MSSPGINTSPIGERLQAERRRLNLKHGECASIGDVTRHTQRNYECGIRSPDASYLAKLAAHGVDVQYVVTGTRAASEAQTIERLSSAWESVDQALAARGQNLPPAKKRALAESIYRTAQEPDSDPTEQVLDMVLQLAQ